MIVDIAKIYGSGRMTQDEYERIVRADVQVRLAYLPKERPAAESGDALEHLREDLKCQELTDGQADMLRKVIDTRVRRKACIEDAVEARKKTWNLSVILNVAEEELRAKEKALEFPTEDEARGYLGKLTNEINAAVVGEIALICCGDISFRPKDVLGLEVYEA